MHDITDEVICDISSQSNAQNKPVIMTTWHEKESIEDALFYFLINIFVDDDYWETTKSSLAIVVNSNEYALKVKNALGNPQEFVRSLVGNEASAKNKQAKFDVNPPIKMVGQLSY